MFSKTLFCRTCTSQIRSLSSPSLTKDRLFSNTELLRRKIVGIKNQDVKTLDGIPFLGKAAQVKKHGDKLQVVDVPVQMPETGEILVHICGSGCCHTDVHAVDGDWPVKSILPLTPGHEGIGKVVAIGDGVTSHKLGDKVGIAWLYSSCGTCEYCVSGWETLCPHQTNSGYGVQGTLQEYQIAKASHALKLPDSFSIHNAPILCAGVTAYKAIKETEVRPGEFLTIIGAAGGLGHLGIQYANAMGLRCIAIDVGDDKLAYCESKGAIPVDAKSPNAVQKVLDITGGGSHGVVCFATQNSAFKTAVDISRRGGTVVPVGLPPGEFPCSIFDIVLKRITIRGSIVGTRKDLAEAVEFANRGLVNCDSKIESIKNIDEVFEKLRKGEVLGRIVIDLTC
jgi:propanol-preferring alcohol dehydrogenase